MACFMDGRLVPLRIRKAHAESVDHHRVRISLAPKPRVEHIEARPRLRGSCPTAVYSVRIPVDRAAALRHRRYPPDSVGVA
jgi:hypothetical protein